jgi:hypothetical protein
MALFTMSFSLAYCKFGLTIIDAYGYQTNWFVMGSLGILWQAASGCKNSSKRKDYSHSNSFAPPLLKGQTNEPDEPFQQCWLYVRYGGLLLSLTRHHFQNNASALKISSFQNQLQKGQTG